jgi:hypothetical protein
LIYVIERLPEGKECQFINLTAEEGFKRPLNQLFPQKGDEITRIDRDQMNIEITRGRSEIYDILTHLTFLYFIELIKLRIVF